MIDPKNNNAASIQNDSKQIVSEQEHNTLAIIAFVSGIPILPFAIAGIIPLICGFIALSQIKKSGQRGRSLAIAAIIMGAAELIFTAVFFIALAIHPDAFF